MDLVIYDYFKHSRKLKLITKKKIEELDYLAIYLLLSEYEDLGATKKRIKARFQFSILNPDGIPGKQAGKVNIVIEAGRYITHQYLFPCINYCSYVVKF